MRPPLCSPLQCSSFALPTSGHGPARVPRCMQMTEVSLTSGFCPSHGFRVGGCSLAFGGVPTIFGLARFLQLPSRHWCDFFGAPTSPRFPWQATSRASAIASRIHVWDNGRNVVAHLALRGCYELALSGLFSVACERKHGVVDLILVHSPTRQGHSTAFVAGS